MNRKEIKRINAKVRRMKHGISKAKVFAATTYRLRELKEQGKGE
jgi:hypothetical protein